MYPSINLVHLNRTLPITAKICRVRNWENRAWICCRRSRRRSWGRANGVFARSSSSPSMETMFCRRRRTAWTTAASVMDSLTMCDAIRSREWELLLPSLLRLGTCIFCSTFFFPLGVPQFLRRALYFFYPNFVLRWWSQGVWAKTGDVVNLWFAF